MSNKKKHKKSMENEEMTVKVDRKTISRILAGVLAGLMVLGTITMTIMYLFGGHVH